MLRHGGSERGAVLVWFAIWLPVLLIFVTFVVDVGNWYQHRRHLQLQADAAAFAGAGKYRFPLSLCSDAAIKGEARAYAGSALDGDENLVVAPYNDQIGGTPPSNVHSLVNFEPDDPTRFWRQAPDNDGAVGPCSAGFIEVKMSEQDLPWFVDLVPPFGLGPKLIPWIDARARVSLFEQTSMSGLLPIAVPDPSPKRVGVTFIRECDGSVLASGELKKQAGLDSGLTVWMNNGTGLPGDPGPVTVGMPTDCKKVGVRIALSYIDSTLACSSPLVDCFELGTSSRGIVFVRSWSATPAGATDAPQARSVELIPGTSCADPYYSVWDTLPDGTTSKQCESLGVRATIDWPSAPSNARVVAELQYGNTPRARLTQDPTTGVWETAPGQFFDLTSIQGKKATGQLGVKLFWCPDASGGQCNNAFDGGEIVQRHLVALEELAGPIKFAQVYENGTPRANSFEAGTAHDLVVRIALLPSLEVAKDINDPLVELKVVGDTSQTQALNCDKDLQNLYEELAWGCGQRLDDPTTAPNEDSPFEEVYTKNDGSTDCRTINRTTLWSWAVGTRSSPDWPCVAISTGAVANQVPRGLNLRIYGDEKPLNCLDGPNNWDMYWGAGLPDDDARVVHVILAPFGQFTGSGNDETAAVTGFATFYVTGYIGQGSGFDPPCAAPTCGTGPECDDPIPGNKPVGVVVGHFIEYRSSVNFGTNGTPCGGGLAPCVAVLTD